VGEHENTFIVFMSDNGAEGHDIQETWPDLREYLQECCDNDYENMGRGNSYVDYGPDWARAGVGVSRLYKGFSTEGGLLVPAFVSHPRGVREGLRYEAFSSVLDVMPTILELAGVAHLGPTYDGRDVLPIQGRSMLPMLTGNAATVHGEDPVMGWELFGRRAVRRGDWKLTYTTAPHGPGRWQLFDLAADPAELHDLSEARPELLAEMLELWDDYVSANGVVLPDAPSAY